MFTVDQSIVPVSEVQGKIQEIIDDVTDSDNMYVVTKDGKPSAIVVGIHHMEKLVPGENNLASLGAAQGAAEVTAATPAPTTDNAQTATNQNTQNTNSFSYDNVTNSNPIEAQTTVAVDSIPNGNQPIVDSSTANPLPADQNAMDTTAPDPASTNVEIDNTAAPDMSESLNDGGAFAMPAETVDANTAFPGTTTEAAPDNLIQNDNSTVNATPVADQNQPIEDSQDAQPQV